MYIEILTLTKRSSVITEVLVIPIIFTRWSQSGNRYNHINENTERSAPWRNALVKWQYEFITMLPRQSDTAVATAVWLWVRIHFGPFRPDIFTYFITGGTDFGELTEFWTHRKKKPHSSLILFMTFQQLNIYCSSTASDKYMSITSLLYLLSVVHAKGLKVWFKWFIDNRRTVRTLM